MAWNEPGKGRDPWGGGNKNNGSGPPDLDQIWKRFRARFSKDGNRNRDSGGGNDNGDGSSSGPSFGPGLIVGVIAAAVVAWLLTGMYIVQPGEKGVLLRFGAYQHTAGPGWHWHLPYPIDRVYEVDTQQVRRASNRAVMLTKDENIVDVEVSAQYRISDANKYLFQLQDPDSTVEQVLRSAVREIVGTSDMNQVIQEGVKVEQLDDEALSNVNLQKGSDQPRNRNGLKDIDHRLVSQIKAQQKNYPKITDRSRAKLPDNVKKIMQYTLDSYNAGVQIIAVNVQYAQPPEAVQGAFQEAIKAREEEERTKNIARAYARDIVARAQGDKAAMIAEARGYKERKINRAQGQAQRFDDLLAQYRDAPDVTRERLYLETMGDVLSSSHVIVNDGNSSMMYLPLQKMLEQGAQQNSKSQDAANNGIDSSNGLDVPMAPDDDNSSNGASGDDDSLRSRSRNS